jgi:hypothetical protein
MGVLCLTVAAVLAQSTVAQRLTHEQAVHDARTFINLLEDTHPDPYTAFGGRVEFRRKAQAILRDLPQDGIAVEDLASRLRELIVPLPGHTSLGRDDRWWDPAPWLPIRFAVSSDYAVFLTGSDLKELDSLLGWRLVGANMHSWDELLIRWRAFSRSENRLGEASVASRMVLSRKFWLNLFPGDNPERITLELESPTGERGRYTISWDERRLAGGPDKFRNPPPRWEQLPASDNPFATTIFDRSSAAYLRVAHIMGREAYEMAWRSNTGNFRDMLKRYYDRQKKPMPEEIAAALQGVSSFFESGVDLLTEMKRCQVPTLIIDLRGNDGGWTPSVYPFLAVLYGDAYYEKNFPGEYVTRQSTLFLQKHNATVAECRLCL